jgi:hypothetical protein
MSAEELKDAIRKLCRVSLHAQGSLNEVFDYLISELGKLTHNDFWAED